MDTDKLKPFDLQKALAGDPVVTRDGRKVLKVAHFPECAGWEVAVHIEGDKNLTAMPQSGRYLAGRGKAGDSEYDLFMAPKQREVWVNIYSPAASCENGIWFESEQEADFAHQPPMTEAKRVRLGNKAHKITFEE